MKRKITIYTILFFLLNLTIIFKSSFSQWQPDTRLTNDPLASYTSFNNAWCIAANGDSVHAVWYDSRNGTFEIYYKRSTDGGVNWGADTRLTNYTAESCYPSIALSGSLVHVVWNDKRDGNWEIYYKRSTDGGSNWGVDTRITNNSAYSYYPSIAAYGSDVHLTWYDYRDGNPEIYYILSTNSGINWGTETRLTNNIGNSYYPSIATLGFITQIVWFDDRDGNQEIYSKRSTDGGINWGSDTRLTNNSAGSGSPCIAVSGMLMHIVWSETRDSNNEIYYKRSTDGGLTWGADIRLTNNTLWSMYPSIAASGLLVHVVWTDNRDGNYEIYYKLSTDGGQNWKSDTRLTNFIAYSDYPSIAVSVSQVHVLWNDTRDANSEIYYKLNPTGNLTGIQNSSSGIPIAFSLEQNYPNPFNPKTVIRFDVMRSPTGAIVDDKVVLKIYDVMGREVETLVNEKLAPGTYETTFDGSKLNSGVYFYRLQTERFTETKRMTLIK